MRSVDQIRHAMHAQPFRPFSLKLVDGSVCTVEHPDFIAVPPGERPREIAFFTEARNRPGGYEAHWIDLGLIVSVIVAVEPVESPAGSTAEGNGG
jgi:hypothetical protein